MILSEGGNVRKSTYDLNQGGVYADKSKVSYPVYFVDDGQLIIVDSCKTGTGIFPTDVRSKMGIFRYYTNCLTQHDYQTRAVKGQPDDHRGGELRQKAARTLYRERAL